MFLTLEKDFYNISPLNILNFAYIDLILPKMYRDTTIIISSFINCTYEYISECYTIDAPKFILA